MQAVRYYNTVIPDRGTTEVKLVAAQLQKIVCAVSLDGFTPQFTLQIGLRYSKLTPSIFASDAYVSCHEPRANLLIPQIPNCSSRSSIQTFGVRQVRFFFTSGTGIGGDRSRGGPPSADTSSCS